MATQGNSATTYGNQWTTSYNISYSEDGFNWKRYAGRLRGNSDINSEVFNYFRPSFFARYVRLHPRSWHDSQKWNVPCLRWELYTAGSDAPAGGSGAPAGGRPAPNQPEPGCCILM